MIDRSVRRVGVTTLVLAASGHYRLVAWLREDRALAAAISRSTGGVRPRPAAAVFARATVMGADSGVPAWSPPV